MAEFHRQYLYARSNHHLVWAIEVTVESYTRGIIRHRLFTYPLSTVRAYASWKVKTGPEAAIARVPAELWAIIEDFLMAEVDAEGDKAVNAYTWNRKRRNANRRKKRDARSLAMDAPEQPVAGEIGATAPGTEEESEELAGGAQAATTSDEDRGEDWSADISESESHRNKMDERAVFFADAARKMCFANWMAPRWGPPSLNHAHLQRHFSLSLHVTTSNTDPWRRDAIKSVYICLPWAQQPSIRQGFTGSVEDKEVHNCTNAQTNLRMSTSNLRPPVDPKVHRNRWKSRYDTHVVEVDAEYLSLTQEKILKLNHAIEVLGLKINDPVGGRGWSGTQLSTLRSSLKMYTQEEWDSHGGYHLWSWKEKAAREPNWVERNLVDNREWPWPEKVENGRKLYMPKLMSISQLTINEPEGSTSDDEVRKWMEDGNDEEW